MPDLPNIAHEALAVGIGVSGFIALGVLLAGIVQAVRRG
jgi:hypothetical protein